MSSNFSSLRANRAKALTKLNEEIQKEQNKKGSDERFWKLTVDQKTKVGYAKLRFLPEPQNEDVPWQYLYVHAFKLNGAWYIENCPTTKGRTCPVCAKNNVLWESGIDADKKIASARKRQKKYISNVLVLEDPAHPENEGQVKLFKYGKKIFEKLEEKMNPKYPSDPQYSPFDLDLGADFKLKSAKQQEFQSYDKSEFAVPAKVYDGDLAQQEELWLKEFPLLPFVADDQFKSYEELEKRYNKVLTGGVGTAEDAIKAEQPTVADATNAVDALDAAEEVAPKPSRKRTKPTASAKTIMVEAEPEGDTPPEDEDSIHAFFEDALK